MARYADHEPDCPWLAAWWRVHTGHGAAPGAKVRRAELC